MKKIIFEANNREIELSFVDGEVIMAGDDKAVAALSINEMRGLKDEALKLFLQKFGDNI